MTKSLALAAALVASAAYSTAALASGDYYEGTITEQAVSVDTFQTSSIQARTHFDNAAAFEVADQSPDHGDYYEGANRPQ